MDRLSALVLSTVVAAAPLPALAGPPRVHFDMPYAVACRDVSPPGFAAANPGQKLVEARLEISSLLTVGQERDLIQYFIRVESPQRTLMVVDFLPKTIHESQMAGPVTLQNSTEKSAALGINLSGKYEVMTVAGPSAGIGQKNTSSVKYDLLPPLETVAASGTLLRGSAVFFKLKSSPRHLLEGSRELALVLRVPAAWRADYLHVRCEAEGIEHGIISALDEHVSCGERDFLVALYQEGDEQARLMAEDLARREAHVRTSARTSPMQNGQAQRTGGSLPQKMGLIPPAKNERNPATSDWLPRLLYGPAGQVAALPERLPREIGQAVADFSAARQRLAEFSGNNRGSPVENRPNALR